MSVRKGAAYALIGTVCVLSLLPGCTKEPAAPTGRSDAANRGAPAPGPRETPADPTPVDVIPGVGALTRAHVPDGTGQALVVSGASLDANEAIVVLYERDATDRWRPTAGPWPAHNALRGWTDSHMVGDLRSPIGVFRIGDAGGRLPDPGARLPYDHDEAYVVQGTGFVGEPLEGSFDYVVAIDYNRVPGTTPLDRSRPLGADKGGGVWIHVDHGGPTQACISLDREVMPRLLRALDPAKDPVVVMGPRDVLAR
ncbi:hypothetical protein [Streptomyces sp. NPDC048577]|uniref:hypothetical protein n=1 Tax=Streptomyces sp. NPDC048577 TaxID=3157209 RepID=UPI00343B6021